VGVAVAPDRELTVCWLAVFAVAVLSACAGVLIMAGISARGWEKGWRCGYRAGRADEAAGLPPEPEKQ